MTKEKEDVIVNVEEAFSKTEQYIEDNKKSLMVIAGAIIALVAIYFGWTKWYVAGQETEAQAAMFNAEYYFEKDSLDKAINGDGNSLGFVDIADQYSVTPSGNLANYYLGVCYLRKGEFEKAIEYLEEYDGDDQMIAPIALGATGDAYLELGKTEEAIENYLKASEKSSNNFTTPLYLKKAGLAYEVTGNYKNAKGIYEKIKTEYPESPSGKEIDKYIARAEALSGN